MQTRIVLLVVLTMMGCKNDAIIESANLKALFIVENNIGHQRESVIREITNPDSLKFVVEKLNKGKKAPIKFYATHHLKFIYNDGQEEIVLCRGTSMKYKGISYELSEPIVGIIDN